MKKSNFINCSYLGWLILILIVIVACTLPSKNDHQEYACNCNNPNPLDVTFYEENLTYMDPAQNDDWEFLTLKEANLSDQTITEGIQKLKSHETVLSFLIIRHDKIVLEQYFHQSQREHSNNIHSLSKSILGALIGIALKEGHIKDLNQSISDFFPSLFKNPDLKNKKNILVRHLITMSAGLDWVEDQTEYLVVRQTDWVEAILKLPYIFNPGEDFLYCTGLSHIASAVITNAADMCTLDFANSHLFNHLGITVERWGYDPQCIYSGGYNFFITPLEIAKFGLLYLNKGKYKNQQLIPENWVIHSLHPQIGVDDNYQYGYYWWVTKINTYDIYKAWGYGGQYLYLIPAADMLVVITSNTHGVYDPLDGDHFIKTHIIPAIIY